MLNLRLSVPPSMKLSTAAGSASVTVNSAENGALSPVPVRVSLKYSFPSAEASLRGISVPAFADAEKLMR